MKPKHTELVRDSLVDKFLRDLREKPLEWVAEHYIFEGTPYVFSDQPKLMEELTNHLSNELDLKSENIRIIGSAKVGFSLNPDNFPRRFSDTSDIDVLVVDEILFDKIWTNVLKWHYPRRLSGLSGNDRDWMRKRRRDVYWGWLHPERIRYDGLSFPEVLKPLRDTSTTWFNAFRSLSRHSEFATRHISGRLYRNWSHARMYHVYTLRQIRENITSH